MMTKTNTSLRSKFIWNIAFFISFSLTLFSNKIFFQNWFLNEFLWAWGIVGINHGLGLLFQRLWIGKDSQKFFIFAVGGSGVKFLLLLTMTAILVFQGQLNTAPFIFSLFVAYFIFLVYDVTKLYKFSIKLK